MLPGYVLFVNQLLSPCNRFHGLRGEEAIPCRQAQTVVNARFFSLLRLDRVHDHAHRLQDNLSQGERWHEAVEAGPGVVPCASVWRLMASSQGEEPTP